MNQINLRRFIHKLYQTKEYDTNLINRVERELAINLKNKYILENILNFLIKMLKIKIKEGGQFEAVSLNKINEMIKVCLEGLDVKENPKHLVCLLNFTGSHLKLITSSVKKDEISTSVNITRSSENTSNKIIINLYSKLLFDDSERTKINEEILSIILQYFSKKFLCLFSDLKYKTNNLNIEILNRNSYKLHLYFLCFFIKTNKIEKEMKQFIKPLYISYFIIENHLTAEKQLNVCDLNFYELKNRKELITETLKILFKKTTKNLNLKKILILKKYNKFMQFIDKNILKETIKSINLFKTVNEDAIKVYEEILLDVFKDKQKVSIKIFNFLESKKQTDLILEYKFLYLILFCNEKLLIEKFMIENLFLIKKQISFNFKLTNVFFKEEELLSIFFYAFYKIISSELNKIFLIEKIYFNNKSPKIYVFELLNYRSSLLPLLGSVYKQTDVIVLNEYLKHILLHLIYKHEIKDISAGIETFLNPKDILKLDLSKNSKICSVVENFLQILIEIIKHFLKLNKSAKIEIDDSLFKHKGLWENSRTRVLLLFIYRLINKSDILENRILKNFTKNYVTPEILGDLQILGNKDATDFILHLLQRECVCLKAGLKKWLEVFERNLLYFEGLNTEKLFIKYIKAESTSTVCLTSKFAVFPFFDFNDSTRIEKADHESSEKYFETPPSKHTFIFLLKLNRHFLSFYLIFLIEKFPHEKYNNLILQLKIERLILLKDFLKELESKHLQLSLFKRTIQSFEIFFDKKIRLFKYKNLKSLSKTNSLALKFQSINLKDFSTENPLINSLKNILTEKDAKKFLDVFFPQNNKEEFPKVFFGEKVYFYFFVLCLLKFEWLFEEKRGVFSSLLFSCEFLDVEIEDFFNEKLKYFFKKTALLFFPSDFSCFQFCGSFSEFFDELLQNCSQF